MHGSIKKRNEGTAIKANKASRYLHAALEIFRLRQEKLLHTLENVVFKHVELTLSSCIG